MEVHAAFASFGGDDLPFCCDLPDVDDLMFQEDLEAFLAGSSGVPEEEIIPGSSVGHSHAPSSPPASCASPPLAPSPVLAPAAALQKASSSREFAGAPLMAFSPAIRLIITQAQAQEAAAASASCGILNLGAVPRFPAALALSLAALRPPLQPCCSEPMSDDSDDTMDDLSNGKPNKRKAPDVDWRSIVDPAERRRQRRLAKNRVTAARSRERKKVQWSEMEVKMNGISSDNAQLRGLLEHVLRENAALKAQVLRLNRSPSSIASAQQGKNASATPESAALILIALMLCALAYLPFDRAVAFGSAIPLLLAALLMAQQGNTDGLGSLLVRFLATSRSLVSRTRLRKSWSTLLFKRHALVGRTTLRSLSLQAAQAEQDGTAPSLIPRTAATHIALGSMEGLQGVPMLSALFDHPLAMPPCMPFPMLGPGSGSGMINVSQLCQL